jgi:hypothetical protein
MITGNQTPRQYIAESISRLVQMQARMIQEDIANGGPGEAPDLHELFAREYPGAVAPEVLVVLV